MFLPVQWVKPENTIHVQTCAVHACLDIHERHRVYMISLDVGQRPEKSCMHERFAHGLTLFTRFGQWIKKKRDKAYFFLFRQEFLVGGLFDTRVSLIISILGNNINLL